MYCNLSDLLGYIAAGLVLATFSVRSIAVLRSVAIASNVMFMVYAGAAELAPVFVLHAALLPLNLWRLHEARREAHDEAGQQTSGPRARGQPDDTLSGEIPGS